MSTEWQIVQAAIRADMEHRGYEHTGGDQFHRSTTYGAMGHVRINYYVSSSGVRIERNPNYGDADQTQEAEALAATLQAEVFGYWPQAIEDVFGKWSLGDVPDPLPFAVAGSYAQTAANELSTGVNVESDGSAYSPGNPRLASDLSNLEGRTKQLAGRYAVAFSDSYVTPLPAVLERQRSLVGILAVAAYAEEAIWTRARADLNQIRTQAYGAMDASGPRGGGNSNSLASSIRAQEEEVRTMLMSVQGAASGHSAGMFDLARPVTAPHRPGRCSITSSRWS